jgi:hypothetical protein
MAPPRGTTKSKTSKIIDTTGSTLEAALKILELLSNATENVPYLNTITGCIQKLIDIQKVCSVFESRCTVAASCRISIGDE